MSRQARLFIGLVGLLGSGVVLYAALTWKIDDLPRFLAYLLTALLASQLKVGLPEVTGTMSVNFLFILIGIAELNFSETLTLGCCAVLVQCYVHGHRWLQPSQLFFNVGSTAVAIWLAYFTYHGPLHLLLRENFALLLMLSACVYFLFNSLPVATIISLTADI